MNKEQPKNEKEQFDYLAKVVLLGESAVGKTNILLRFCQNHYKPTHVSTIGVDFKIKTITVDHTRIKMQIWDTAGQEKYRSVTEVFFKGAAGIILVYSITDRNSFTHLQNWIQQIQEKIESTSPVAKLIVGNKCDSRERQVSYEEGKQAAEKYRAPFLEVSALENIKVDELFLTLGQKLKENMDAWHQLATKEEPRGIVMPPGGLTRKKKCAC